MDLLVLVELWRLERDNSTATWMMSSAVEVAIWSTLSMRGVCFIPHFAFSRFCFSNVAQSPHTRHCSVSTEMPAYIQMTCSGLGGSQRSSALVTFSNSWSLSRGGSDILAMLWLCGERWWEKVNDSMPVLSAAPPPPKKTLSHNHSTMKINRQAQLRESVEKCSGNDGVEMKKKNKGMRGGNCQRRAWLDVKKCGWGIDRRGDSDSDRTIDLVLLKLRQHFCGVKVWSRLLNPILGNEMPMPPLN